MRGPEPQRLLKPSGRRGGARQGGWKSMPRERPAQRWMPRAWPLSWANQPALLPRTAPGWPRLEGAEPLPALPAQRRRVGQEPSLPAVPCSPCPPPERRPRPRRRLCRATRPTSRHRHLQPKLAARTRARPRTWSSPQAARDQAAKVREWNGREVSTGNPKVRGVPGKAWLRESTPRPELPGPSPESGSLTAGQRRLPEEAPGPRLQKREVGASYAP